MDNSFILSHVDHTLLKPTATWEEIATLCDEAISYNTASVCVPPHYVQRIHNEYGNAINICTVIGFPLGYSHILAKGTEISCALSEGANEIDMVINLCDVKNGKFQKITKELVTLKQELEQKILKVIIETCYLTQDEKIALCNCVTQAGADYIKTSTGFGSGGALMSDIQLFKDHIGKDVKIKAAGGIRTREDMVAFLEAGCDRLGTSSAIMIVSGQQGNGY